MNTGILGIRVIRGPDWSGRNIDGGEGGLGTVVNVSKLKVTVIWDNGKQGDYKAGTDNKYELLIYDNAPTGVVHNNIVCDLCRTSPITGIRWKCRQCSDYDLCTLCFMSQKQRQCESHGYLRYIKESSTVVPVTSQNESRQIELHGILPGSEVIRGIHWEWADDDGGKNNVGRVEKVVKYGVNCYRGGVLVQWPNKHKTDYRVGGEGVVDLICTERNSIKYPCFPGCLPLLDLANYKGEELTVGDKVKIIDDIEAVQKLLVEKGNWDPAIEKYIDKELTVIGFAPEIRNLVILQYKNTQKWYMYKSLLIKMHSFKEKDIVRIIEQPLNRMMELQEGHGGWLDEMEQTKGRVGRVIEVWDDGDLTVQVGDKQCIYSPVCCIPISITDDLSVAASEVAEIVRWSEESGSFSPNSTEPNSTAEDLSNTITEALGKILQMPLMSQGLVAAAAQGDIKAVQHILSIEPAKVDIVIQGKTALQMACHKGHMKIVQHLLSNKANVNLADEDGDTPLHFAVSGHQLKLVVLLCNNGAAINALNKKQHTPFHLAVCENYTDITKYLFDEDCETNTQDNEGDTPLHDALEHTDNEILLLMLSENRAVRIDIDILNEEGLTAVHKAIIKHVNEKIFKSMIQMIENTDKLKTKIGLHTPLHVAAIGLNSNTSLAKVLVKQDVCNINEEDIDGRTALHLATIVKSEPMIDLLAYNEADINHKDKDGNTAIHLSLMNIMINTTSSIRHASRYDQSSEDIHGIPYLLVTQRANLNTRNDEGQTPLDLLQHAHERKHLQRISELVKKKNQQGIPEYWCPMKNDRVKLITIDFKTTEGSDEYHKVVRLFLKTVGNRRVCQIERIQNIDKWEAYAVKKTSMERTYGVGCVNERSLFHGTKPELKETITKQGLDVRETMSGLFGRGIYLTSDAKFADSYTQQDTQNNGCRYIFVCKVLVGSVTMGNRDMTKPPPIDNKYPDVIYDTAVDNVDKPKTFVVFENCQCYPEYLIAYK